jgi:hypothetical protein
MRKRFVIPVAVLIAAGLAGGAFAASQATSNPQQAFIKDAAGRLHVTPNQLTSALKGALIDRLNAAASAGTLSHAQASAIISKLKHGAGLPFGPGPIAFGPAPLLFGSRGAMLGMARPGGAMFGIARPVPFGGPLLGPPAIVAGAASYLGLSMQQLMRDLSNGKSLAAIAKAQGKTTAGLEQAIITALRSRVAKAVKAGELPSDFEQKLLERIKAVLPQALTNTPHIERLPHGFKLRGGPGVPPPLLGGLLGLLPMEQLHAKVQAVPSP